MAAAPDAGSMDINTAIQEVLKAALINDGLARGLHETTKSLDKRQALLCVLAENCDEKEYKKLVQALCQEHQIPLIKVSKLNCTMKCLFRLIDSLVWFKFFCIIKRNSYFQVDSNMKLGEWAGLCKLDKDGKARKVVKCSSAVVRDWGKESPALDIVKEYIKSQKA